MSLACFYKKALASHCECCKLSALFGQTLLAPLWTPPPAHCVSSFRAMSFAPYICNSISSAVRSLLWDLRIRYAICSVPLALCHLRPVAVSSDVGSSLWGLRHAICALLHCCAIFARGSTLCYLRSTLLLCTSLWDLRCDICTVPFALCHLICALLLSPVMWGFRSGIYANYVI